VAEVFLKTDEEVELMRLSNLLVSKALARVAEIIKPGVTGYRINDEAEQVIRDNGGIPGFLNHGGFPGTLCISVNEGVVHGIPTDREFLETDIVSVDCGVLMNGFYGDSAFTFCFSGIDGATHQLCIDTRNSLYAGIEQAVVGNRIGDIGHAIQQYTERERGYSVVRELVGHGIGQNLHEAPEVPNYGKRGRGLKLRDGLVIAIEPMVNLGKKKVTQSSDGYTIVTKDKSPSAHYEHSVCVRDGSADILSDHTGIEEAIKNNDTLLDIPVNS
jgi:methionyl aminopeptidase